MKISVINPKKSVSRINRLLLFIIFLVICIHLASLITIHSINKAFNKYGILGKCFIFFMGALFLLNIFVIVRWVGNTDPIEGFSCPPFTVNGVITSSSGITAQSDDTNNTPFMDPFRYTCSPGMMGPIPSARNHLDQTLIKNAAIIQSDGKAQSVYDSV